MFPLISLFSILCLNIIYNIEKEIMSKTIEEIRLFLIDYIKKNPTTLKALAKEMKINPIGLGNFIRGKAIPQFKSLVLIENWYESKDK